MPGPCPAGCMNAAPTCFLEALSFMVLFTIQAILVSCLRPSGELPVHCTAQRPIISLCDTLCTQSLHAVSCACSLVFGLLFPAFHSFEAIESSNKTDDQQVCTVTGERGAVESSGLHLRLHEETKSQSKLQPTPAAGPDTLMLCCSGSSTGCSMQSFRCWSQHCGPS